MGRAGLNGRPLRQPSRAGSHAWVEGRGYRGGGPPGPGPVGSSGDDTRPEDEVEELAAAVVLTLVTSSACSSRAPDTSST